MSLQCDKCGKSYPTNAALYQHKHLAHPKPKLVLVNHSHNDQGGFKRPSRDALPQPKTKKRIVSPPVTKHVHPEEKPREYEIKPNPNPNDNSQTDDGSRVIVDYDSDGQSDGDKQSDDGLTVINTADSPDYRKLYEKCMESKKLIEEGCQHKLNEVQKKHEEKLNSLKENYKSKLQEHGNEMRETYDERIARIKDAHNIAIKNLQDEHEKEMDNYEQECKRKIKLLKDQLQAIKDDDEDMSSLTKAIFNCNTMEEIFQIQKLVKNHRIDELVQNHLPTLQNLFLSLSHGVLPICQPQRDKVTDEQRSLVEQLQTASKPSAKNILRNKRGDVINLFTIIKDSIKLARDTYNRYGTFV